MIEVVGAYSRGSFRWPMPNFLGARVLIVIPMLLLVRKGLVWGQ